MAVDGVGGSSSTQGSNQRGDRMNDLDTDAFLKLMIAEMQNQDPLDPMDNTKMLEQISQIRSISSNDKLANTLDSVLLGQNISSANSLIGKEVQALSTENKNITGVVTRATIVNGEPFLTIGDVGFAKLSNVWGVNEPGQTPAPDPTSDPDPDTNTETEST
jgi:flagellar basal-body rod modification protein FlgD